MAETNDFDLFIGLVLARLYEARPARQDFEASDFIEPLDGDVQYDSNRVDNWCYTMFWLKTEGYIRTYDEFGGAVSYNFSGTELTEKGFRALNTLPAQLKASEPGKSFGKQLVDLGKQTGWKAAARVADAGGNQASKQASHAIGELIKGWFT